VCTLFLEFVWKVHNRDRLEGTFLDAYAAPWAQNLYNDGFSLLKPNSLNVASYLRAEPEACSIATLGLAFGQINNGDPDLGAPPRGIKRKDASSPLINLSAFRIPRKKEHINNGKT